MQTGTRCKGRAEATECRLAVAVPKFDVMFFANLMGLTAREDASAIRNSITRIPPGSVAVPPLWFRTTVDEAEEILRDAHLVPITPQPRRSDWAIGSEPSAGAVISNNTSVEIIASEPEG
ncbi:MAG TPA: hypothetical protein VFK41_09030 [Nocardioidaceae bacterium]|nr:hypothetical protein [Nocardioidaceae bacterium]